jgi:hypothetical protein
MSPQVNGAGILYNIATIPTTSYLLNRFIFAPTMDGDPSYQAMTRWTHYFLCESFVHPFVMWPMGFDNFKAQTVGRAILTPFVVAEAKLFPSYLDSWPGFRLYNRRLFGVEDDETGSWTVDNSVGAAQAVSSAIRFWEWDEEIDTNSAMDIFENGMTSAQVDPVFGIWGTSEDSTIYFEDRAIETYSAEEGCVRDVMLKGVNIEKSRECREMHPRMQKDLKKELPYWQEIAKEQNLTMKELYQERAENLAANFTNWMEAERKGIVQPEGYARLGTARRRTLVLVAAYIKNDVDAANGPKGSEAEREALRPYADLMERYSCLFDKIPNLDAPGKWDDFIDEVNKGTSPALRFSLDFEVTRE